MVFCSPVCVTPDTCAIPAQVAAVPGWDSLVLRPAVPADRDAVIAVINAIAAEKLYFRTLHYCPTPLWEQALAQGLNPQDGILLAVVEHAGTVAGFGRLLPDDPPSDGARAVNVGVGLLPAYRSQGIGSHLLPYLVTWAAHLGYAVLNAEIFAHNARSRRLFARAGFRVVGRRRVLVAFSPDPQWEVFVEFRVFSENR